MGVDRTDYLMFAVDVGAKAFDWDSHTPELEGAPDRRFDLVFDGMSGEYCMAGKVIAQSDPYSGHQKTVIDPAVLNVDREALAAKISSAFSKPIHPDDLSLVLFSHFS